MKIIFITGASKGFGRSLALQFAHSYSQEEVHFYLSARNATELEALRDEIVHKSPKNHHVHLSVVDLGDVSHLSDTVTKLMSDSNSWAQADDLLFISNAGSLGNLAPIGSSSFRPENIASAIDLNVTSYCYLTSEFIRRSVLRL